MTDTPEDKARRGRGLTPGHWIAIATIAVAVLGGVLSWALSEHNTRLANVESATTNMAEGLARVEGSIKVINERLNGFEERVDDRLDRFEEGVDDRLDRIETNIDRLIQLHLDAGTGQPAASRDIVSDRAHQGAGPRLRADR